jgi:glycosyltransferase involved in cell wall biosynthesis
MRILFALPGLHKYDRGAEIAFIAVAHELAKAGDEVTLIGSGQPRASELYRFVHAGSIGREHFVAFPPLPLLRNETAYEELTFAPALLQQYRPTDYDITLTCSYPFTNWILRRSAAGRRPPHVFVTQNGDWPAASQDSEYRFFGCEGLVCTNPDFYERNKARWRCKLIPNGIDIGRFGPGESACATFGIPDGRLVVLMVSALIASKRVADGIEAVRRVPGAHLVVAGSGPLQASVEAAAAEKLPGRFTLVSVPAEKMPLLYRSADVFLHLSAEESFGNVFLEAMAGGLPIVGHDSPRLRWIVGDGEFLIDTRDHDTVAAAINAAAAEPKEKSAARIARAAEFSWAKVGALYREFLQDIVAANQ